MDEQRKHAILFAATLLCALKLIETIESDKPNFARQYFLDRAIHEARFVLEGIDEWWPEWTQSPALMVTISCMATTSFGVGVQAPYPPSPRP